MGNYVVTTKTIRFIGNVIETLVYLMLKQIKLRCLPYASVFNSVLYLWAYQGISPKTCLEILDSAENNFPGQTL